MGTEDQNGAAVVIVNPGLENVKLDDIVNPAPDMQERDKSRERMPLDKGVKVPNWRGAVIKDRSLWVKWSFGKGKWAPQLRFNPIVAPIAVAAVLAFVMWCIFDTIDAADLLMSAKSTITRNFCWIYIGSMDCWAVVILAIYFSKYGNMKLGKEDEEPEYPDGSWFAMLFACGVGVGLFFYAVAEPIQHYTLPNRYTADRYKTEDELAQFAINTTFFHWGFHAWVVYGMVGMLLAFITYRKGLPMTMKSCFYPLIGDRIYGWMGDLVDIMSIMTTLFGVCTSLGLGTLQLNAGLNYIFPSVEKDTLAQVIIIWAITGIATISVVTGVGVGVRRLSEVCFGLGMFLMMIVFFMGDSWFILNLYTQSIGFYLQNMLGLGFHTDAFQLMNISSADGVSRGRKYPDGEADSPEEWMNIWTIFYWGWWISWSPFVGMFIAKISKGRTIRQFINGTLTAPMIYTFLWLTIFGGTAIRTEKIAALSSFEVSSGNYHPYCCTVRPSELNWNITSDASWKDNLVKDLNKTYAIWQDLEKCVKDMIDIWDTKWKNDQEDYDKDKTDLDNFSLFYNVKRNRYRMSISEDRSMVRLSCIEVDDMWFALMYTNGNLGTFLCVVSLFGIVLYFVTSSDSGSLVIDILAANGDQDPPRLQRVFWACLEGATATALLVAGGEQALSALQTASIVTGLPYSIIMSLMAISLWRGLAMEFGDLNPYGADFKIGIVDPISKWEPSLWCAFLRNLFITPVVLYQSLQSRGSSRGSSIAVLIVGYLTWGSWILLLILNSILPGLYAIAWFCYLSFVSILAAIRADIRAKCNIHGNPVEDFFASLIMYPSVAIQIESAPKKGGLSTLAPMSIKKRKDKSKSTEGV